ncbi:MAG: hypothetical protein LBD02_02225 [Christensenellaceae bacterium]|nr:hypothetical protein [Christensenellaceae bacterium]
MKAENAQGGVYSTFLLKALADDEGLTVEEKRAMGNFDLPRHERSLERILEREQQCAVNEGRSFLLRLSFAMARAPQPGGIKKT